jgi:hypothetical protein
MAAGGVPFLCPFKLLFENLTTLFVKVDREREQQLKGFVDSSGTIFDCFLNNPAVRRMLVSSEGGSNSDNVRSAVEWALKNDLK